MPYINTLEITPEYAKFVLEPLEKGYVQTIGNALRRVLLSSIPGIAVKAVKIENIDHEFSAIPGLKEDATEVLLNIKDLAIKIDPDLTHIEDIVLKINVKGPGQITGADVICPESVEIVNPESYIATISEPHQTFNMEIYIGKGTGYVLPERHEEFKGVIGILPIGTQYTPIKKVNYIVEQTRVETRTDFERLVLEVWTNGSVTPNDALTQGSQILDKYFRMFFEIGRMDQSLVAEDIPVEDPLIANVPELKIDELQFSQRTYNCLRRSAITNLRQLAQVTENDLVGIRGFGKKSLNEVRDKLEEYGIQLKRLEGYRTPLDLMDDDEDDLDLE